MWGGSISENTFVGRIVAMIAIAIGIIIIAVAVFDIHIERNAVAIINPRIRRLGLVPVILIIFNAILLWSPHLCIDMAMIKPPRKRKITLSA